LTSEIIQRLTHRFRRDIDLYGSDGALLGMIGAAAISQGEATSETLGGGHDLRFHGPGFSSARFDRGVGWIRVGIRGNGIRSAEQAYGCGEKRGRHGIEPHLGKRGEEIADGYLPA